MARIALVISGLGPGGAERVLSVLANAWAARGDHVTLITLEPPTARPFYPLHPAITVQPLGLMAASSGVVAAIKANLGRLVRLRRAIGAARPEGVLSFGSEMNVLVLLASVGLGRPVVVAERNDPRQYPPGRPWRRLRRLLYPVLANRIVAQTAEAATFFDPAWDSGTGRRRVMVIPNPRPLLDDQPPRPLAPRPCVMAMGRLVADKGFDLLLEAFARIAARHPDWSLVIVGEGSDRAALEHQVAAAGLAGRVTLPGTVSDPLAVLRAADLFVLSSRIEGFPNVLAEAMACGLPVIAADCGGGGPRALVSDGVDGVLVPVLDVSALAAALDRLMADPALRNRLAAAAPARLERLAVPNILAQWDAALGLADATDAGGG